MALMENRNPDGCADYCAPKPTQENQGECIAQARERIVEFSKTVKNEGTSQSGEGRSRCLAQCSQIWLGAQERDDKRGGSHCRPNPIPAHQNCSQCNPIRRPDRPQITAP